MAVCPIIVQFSTWRVRSMHDVACEFACAVVRSKDTQKQLARMPLIVNFRKSVKLCQPSLNRPTQSTWHS